MVIIAHPIARAPYIDVGYIGMHVYNVPVAGSAWIPQRLYVYMGPDGIPHIVL